MLSKAAAFVLFVVFCFLVSESQVAAKPAFKATVSATGINYAKDVAVAMLLKKCAVLNIPNQAGKNGAPVVGTIDWALTNIFLVGLNIPISGILYNPGVGVTMALNGGVAGQFNFYWHQQGFPHLSGSGTIDVFFAGVYIAVLLVMGESNGRPTIGVAAINVGIDTENIQVHGSFAWFYQFVVDVLAGPIKGWTIDGLKQGITSALDTSGNTALQTIPIIDKLDSIAEIDYGLVSAPRFVSNYVTLDSKGEFYNIAAPVEAPYPITDMPDVVTGQMVQFFFNSFIANSASFVYFKAGIMQAVLQDKDLPNWSPIRLNTTYFKDLIPQLYTDYPNMLMELQTLAIQPPLTTFSASGGAVFGQSEFRVFVIDSKNGNKLEPIFTLGVNISASAKVFSMPAQKVGAELNYLNSTFGLYFSKYGNFNFNTLNEDIKLLCTKYIVPFFNSFLSIGITVPTIEGVTFVNPTIGYGDGYVYLSTDVSYNAGEEPLALPSKDASLLSRDIVLDDILKMKVVDEE